MKRALLTLALVTAAGAAAAQGLPPPIVGSGNTGVLSVGASAPPGGGSRLDTNVAVAKAQRSAAMDPMGSDAVAALRSDVNIASAPAPAPRPTGAALAAQRRIEQAGYTVAENPQKGPDGRWYALAMRGNTFFTVSVDGAGRVSQ